MNVVDSSGWLEYFSGSERADFFAPAIEDSEHLLVPVLCIYEVFKKILQTQGQSVAETRAANLLMGKVIDLTAPLAMSAALLINCLWLIASFLQLRENIALPYGLRTNALRAWKTYSTSKKIKS
jgi:hypothetical protein